MVILTISSGNLTAFVPLYHDYVPLDTDINKQKKELKHGYLKTVKRIALHQSYGLMKIASETT